jgi:hypothetical protein
VKLKRCYSVKVILALSLQWKPIPVAGQNIKKERKKKSIKACGGGGDSAFLTFPLD